MGNFMEYENYLNEFLQKYNLKMKKIRNIKI